MRLSAKATIKIDFFGEKGIKTQQGVTVGSVPRLHKNVNNNASSKLL